MSTSNAARSDTGDATLPADVVSDMRAKVDATQARGNDLEALPSRLSPSRASDYMQCPRLFFYKTIAKIREPGSMATLRGTLAHVAFERIFDHPAGERTPDLAVSYLRPAWEALLNPDLNTLEGRDAEIAAEQAADARQVAAPGTDAETELLTSTEAVVRSWFDMERVNNFSPAQIELPTGEVVDGREFHAIAEVGGVTLHGFLDRLDRYTTADGRVVFVISDYKTGKAPGEGKKYSPWTMRKIRDDKFFQLRVYALLMWEMYRIPVHSLRLIFVKSGDRENGILTEPVTQRMINSTRAQVRSLWQQIHRSARTGTWDTKTGPLCNWCYFQDICPAFSTQDTDVNPLLPQTQDRRAS